MSERITTANDKYAREIGFDYGASSSGVQAALLNGFAEAMKSFPGDPDMQMAYIAHDMTPSARRFWERFAVFASEDES